MKSINEIEFNEKLKEEKIFLVDFWAEWCAPCKMINPILEKLENEIENVEFLKINVEEYGSLADNYSIGRIPTLLIIKNGEVLNKIVGFKSEGIIKKEILKTIGD